MEMSNTEQEAYNQKIELSKEDRRSKDRQYYALHKDAILARRRAKRADDIQNHPEKIQMQRLKETKRKQGYRVCCKEHEGAVQTTDSMNNCTGLPSTHPQ